MFLKEVIRPNRSNAAKTTYLFGCDTCTKQFETNKSNAARRMACKRGQFCSISCSSKVISYTNICCSCSKRFITKIPTTKSCSAECRTAWYKVRLQKIREKRKVTHKRNAVCKHCTNNFSYTFRNDRKEREFCGRSCASKWNMKNLLVCKNQYANFQKKGLAGPARKKAFQTKIQRGYFNGTSRAELKFYEALQIVFGQENVCHHETVNGWSIDFFVAGINAYVQFDGVYWHGLNRSIEEIKEFKNSNDKSIYGTWQRDQHQNFWFPAHNLKLVRVTDEEFNMASDKLDFIKLHVK
jgi:hypothetical protein